MSGYQGGYQYANVPNADQVSSTDTSRTEAGGTAAPETSGGDSYMSNYIQYMNSYNQYSNNSGITSDNESWEVLEQSKRNRIKLFMALGLFFLIMWSLPKDSHRDSRHPTNVPSDASGSNIRTDGLPATTAPVDDQSATSGGNEEEGGGNEAHASDKKEAATDAPVLERFDIGYFLTYPMSGTTFTRALYSFITSDSTATNYERDAYTMHNKPMSILGKALETGSNTNYPFWHNKIDFNSDRPILTMTHCQGYCQYPCKMDEYVTTHEVFEEHCRMISDSTHELSEFKILGITPKSDVKKVVHLMRAPISNVVSRFHFDNNIVFQGEFDRDQEGFLEWCEKMDNDPEQIAALEETKLITEEAKASMKGLPCAIEFYKYVTWHNHVETMIWEGQYPNITIYFENYNTIEGRALTANLIADFMDAEIPKLEYIPVFETRSYEKYFDEEQKAKLKKFIKTLAFSSTWKLLEVYFT